MKNPIPLIFLIASVCFAQPTDFTVLNRVPAERATAFKAYKDSSTGSPEERGDGRQKYVEDLSKIIFELRDTYYLKTGKDGTDQSFLVTDDLLKSVEKTALLFENIEYPKNVAAGSSLWYEDQVHRRKVQLLEMVILRMSRAIVHESWDWSAKESPRTPFDYKAWLNAWYAAAEDIPVPSSIE